MSEPVRVDEADPDITIDNPAGAEPMLGFDNVGGNQYVSFETPLRPIVDWVRRNRADMLSYASEGPMICRCRELQPDTGVVSIDIMVSCHKCDPRPELLRCDVVHPKLKVGESCRKCGWTWTESSHLAVGRQLVQMVADHLGDSSDLAKEAFLDELKATICIHCGRKQAKTSSRCQCWNDD
jgi:hypothetical protein